jgi:hypothetical protein
MKNQKMHRIGNAPTQAVRSLPAGARRIAVEFGPCQTKTPRMPRDRAAPVRETDFRA